MRAKTFLASVLFLTGTSLLLMVSSKLMAQNPSDDGSFTDSGSPTFEPPQPPVKLPDLQRPTTKPKKASPKKKSPPMRLQSLTTDLLGHWKLDETSGSTAADSSGNGRNGTIKTANQTTVNGVWVAGKINNGLSLTGLSNTYSVTVPDGSGSLNVTGSFTVSAWIYLNSNPMSTRRIVAKSGAYDLSIIAGARPQFTVGSATVTVSTSSNWVWAGEWYHLAGVYEPTEQGQTLKLYLNGKLVGQTTPTFSLPNNMNAVNLGHAASWRGVLDDVRLYSKALTGDEIETLSGKIRVTADPTATHIGGEVWFTAVAPYGLSWNGTQSWSVSEGGSILETQTNGENAFSLVSFGASGVGTATVSTVVGGTTLTGSGTATWMGVQRITAHTDEDEADSDAEGEGALLVSTTHPTQTVTLRATLTSSQSVSLQQFRWVKLDLGLGEEAEEEEFGWGQLEVAFPRDEQGHYRIKAKFGDADPGKSVEVFLCDADLSTTELISGVTIEHALHPSIGIGLAHRIDVKIKLFGGDASRRFAIDFTPQGTTTILNIQSVTFGNFVQQNNATFTSSGATFTVSGLKSQYATLSLYVTGVNPGTTTAQLYTTLKIKKADGQTVLNQFKNDPQTERDERQTLAVGVELQFKNSGTLTQVETGGVGYNNPQHNAVVEFWGTDALGATIPVGLTKALNTQETRGTVSGANEGWAWHRDVVVRRYLYKPNSGTVTEIQAMFSLDFSGAPPGNGNDSESSAPDSTPDDNKQIFTADGPSIGLMLGTGDDNLDNALNGSVAALRFSAREWVTHNGVVVSTILKWHSFVTIKKTGGFMSPWERVGQNKIELGEVAPSFPLSEAQEAAGESP